MVCHYSSLFPARGDAILFEIGTDGAAPYTFMELPYRQALARCVRVSIGLEPEPAGPLHGIDPTRLIELANHHNLVPHAAAAGLPVPGDWSQRWTRASLLLASEAARLIAALETASIRVMPLKGPVLAHMLHGDPGGRQYADLDLMVEPGRENNAAAALRAAGYESKWPPRTAARQARFNWYEELPLRHGRNGIDVDLHWSFTPRHYLARMDGGAVWARAERTEFLGRAVEVPAPEDYLEYLCLHGARHEWSRLGWLADLAAFRVRFGARLDLPALTRRSQGGALIADGLRRAAEWLGEPAGDLGTPRPVPAWRRLRYRAAVLLIPTEADWAEQDLPRSLEPLYYPLRLIRLIQRRLGRLD